MIRRRSAMAVLLRASQAVLTAATDATREADAHELAYRNGGVCLWLSWSKGDDTTDAFVAADMW